MHFVDSLLAGSLQQVVEYYMAFVQREEEVSAGLIAHFTHSFTHLDTKEVSARTFLYNLLRCNRLKTVS